MLADIVFPDELAEAIAEIYSAGDPNINADVRTKNWPGRGKIRCWQGECRAGTNQPLCLAGEMDYALAGAEIRTYPAAALSKV